jgi:hypothetical protein
MAGDGVTFEKVAEICDKLQAEGRAGELEDLLKEAEGRAEELRGVIEEDKLARADPALKEKADAGQKRAAELERTVGELRQGNIEAEKRIAVAEAMAQDREKQLMLLRSRLKEATEDHARMIRERADAEKRAAVAEAKLTAQKKRPGERKRRLLS